MAAEFYILLVKSRNTDNIVVGGIIGEIIREVDQKHVGLIAVGLQFGRDCPWMWFRCLSLAALSIRCGTMPARQSCSSRANPFG